DSMHFLPKLQTSSAMEGASFVSKKTGEFSPENSWVKIAWMQFLPALQGSAALHCLTATATPPFQSGLGSLARKTFLAQMKM
ncbi:MAG: hypothetical protein II413_11405, partial [Treponema sp.]|nr:hypothetical protein [Treponema sp.]